MALLTLLDMTQNILSAMDSDAANSIDDTVEAQQVATIIKETYFDLMSQRDWPFLRTSFSLTGLGSSTTPTKMLIPTNINKVLWVKYNKVDVTYLDPKDFQDMLDNRVETTGVVDSNGFGLDHDAVYWTTFDDQYIIFDSYTEDDESSMQTSNSLCYGVQSPSWTHSDTFVPTLPDKMFPTLLADAKATCFLNIKQQANAREERRAQRGRNIMRNEAWKANAAEGKYNGKVNYGRG